METKQDLTSERERESVSDQLLIRTVAQMNMFRHTHTRERESISKKEKQCELVFSNNSKIEFLSSWTSEIIE